MVETTIVLPTARAIRHEQLQIESQTLFLPTYITMSEFLSKLCIVDGYKLADADTRILLLLEASDFASFKELQIERNFFTFTKNSTYIFKFFEELSAELYNIDNLSNTDIYAEYEEHIAILQELYKRYEQLCNEKKILDKIFLPKLYKFNKVFAQRFQNIDIYVEGYLTNFEIELLLKCCEYCTINIIVNTTKFNRKIQDKLSEYSDILEIGYNYTISLNQRKIVHKTKLHKNTKIECTSFGEKLLQIGFIQQKVYEFIEKGYQANKIVVVLPDEKTAELLELFDKKDNFNLAMGKTFKNSTIYKKLDAALSMIEQDSCENTARVHRVGEEIYLAIREFTQKRESGKDFIEILKHISAYISNKTELKIYNEELYLFEKLLPFMQSMANTSKLSLFMQRLSKRSIDDIRGGKITVMGVLETRMIEFDAVIIVDFDDKNVPKRSDKDMFLNTTLRERASLPTMNDRENLQKHYYEMLIHRSKEVAISYVHSSQSSASRFLRQLGIKERKVHEDISYAKILFPDSHVVSKEEREIVVEYSFKDKHLSSTMLKTYLTCKRRYYYKYILKLKNHNIPRDMPQEHEIGTALHQALKELYSKQSSYNNFQDLKRDLDKELDVFKGKSELELYLIAMQKKRLEGFCHNEVKRFRDGYEVIYTEKQLTSEFAGMHITGVLDRIDKKDNAIEVIDYKTGSYALYNKNNVSEATDFQLEFYNILAGEFGNVEGCYFYDLKEGNLVSESFLNEKKEILRAHIKDLQMVEEIECAKTEDLKSCLYCEFAMMCGRD